MKATCQQCGRQTDCRGSCVGVLSLVCATCNATTRHYIATNVGRIIKLDEFNEVWVPGHPPPQHAVQGTTTLGEIFRMAALVALLCLISSCVGTREQRAALRTLTPLPLPQRELDAPQADSLSTAARQLDALTKLQPIND